MSRTLDPSGSAPDRSPPHSFEAEEHVIAVALLDSGESFDRAVAAKVTFNSFYSPANRLIWEVLADMRKTGKLLSLEILSEELATRRLTEQVGGYPYLMQVTGRIPTTAHAGYFIEKLREKELLREVIKDHTQAIEAAYGYTGGLDEFLAERKARTDRLAASIGGVPSGLPARPLTSFEMPGKGDPSILIGNRWLSRGDIAILASTSGMGKSSLSIQAATHWALGLPLFGGFLPSRPLRSLICQAEDGDGDIAEVRYSLQHAMKLTDEQLAQVKERVLIVTDRIHRGLSFRAELERQIALHKPDIVWVNPLLAFLGGDVNDSTDVGAFLREQLNSLNEPAQFAYIIVHHTAKPPKERKQRQWNEVMYEMAGSADLTNAARAILALQATLTPGEFHLIAAKRGLRTGLTKKVAQGAGFRLDPTTTICVRHSKDRMEINGQDLPVIHWERGDDPEEVAPEAKAGRKASATLAKFEHKLPTTAAGAKPVGMIHKEVRDLTELTYNGFKKVVLRAHEDGYIQMVERTGLGPCFYRPVGDNIGDKNGA